MKIKSRNSPLKIKKLHKTVDVDHIKTLLLMKRFEEIRRKRKMKEKEEREREKKKNDESQWRKVISRDEVLGYQFRRNPFAERKGNKFDIQKHKNLLSQPLKEKNNMNDALNIVKSKLNLNQDDDLAIIKQKIEKSQIKNLPKYTKFTSHKGKLIKNKNFESEFKIKNYIINEKKRRFSVIPPKHGKNYYMLHTLPNSYKVVNTDYSNNIMKKRRPQTTKQEINVIDKPIYTIDILDFIDEFNRINSNTLSESKRFKKRHLTDYNKIDELMEIKNEMHMFCLKDKYLHTRFPKNKKNKDFIPKIDIFIDKMITECERIDYDLYN